MSFNGEESYFFADLAPIHASCMTVDGAGFLLAGIRMNSTRRMAGRNYGLKGLRLVLFILIPTSSPPRAASTTAVMRCGGCS